MRTPVVVVERGCGPAGCVLLLLPILTLVGLVGAFDALFDATMPGTAPWWVDTLAAVVVLNVLFRLVRRRVRRRLGLDRRPGGPPGMIDGSGVIDV